MANIDYMTVSLGQHKFYIEGSTEYVVKEFASILPEIYRDTCHDMQILEGRSMRATQYGISAALQYGSALLQGWAFTVQLSGAYWEACGRNCEAVLGILKQFTDYRVSRLDLEVTALVPLGEWRDYCKSAFEAEQNVIGAAEAMTVSYGSRLSQIYARVYCKSSEDPIHYPASDGKVQIRLEIEIKRIKGEKILEPAFLNPVFADKLFLQRVRHIAKNDSTGFLSRYFDNGSDIDRIETVKRTVGDFEDTVKYVLKTYEPYILAGLKSEKIKSKLQMGLSPKTKKILAVLNQCGDVKRDSKVGEENGQQKSD